ncbi:hypothetical protein MIZ03_0247 [Rhodoferax lithotrophicus]|uniref:DUF1737 domain-containing protein n=1 Tax=Rhodoferax lithotrophicus TaxID=2798804 RepID=A0ABM7MGQ9_9BURK|nr:hypothetical protein MIZ03_0247 [Rhodoferax sp. MIZ03]
MQKVVEYTVVSGKLPTLIAEVNELIKDGWQPLGACQDSSSEDSFIGIQTMVKYPTPHLTAR